MNIVTEIASILFGGISTTASGVGNGLKELVTAIFLNVDATTNAVTGLSTFGIVAVSFMGVSLAIGLSRFVLNWVTSLGR